MAIRGVVMGVRWKKNVSETLTIADSNVFSIGKWLAETITTNDYVAKGVTLSQSETLSLLDSLVKNYISYKTETLTTTDSYTTLLTYIREVAEALNLSDSLVTTLISVIYFTENITLLDKLIPFPRYRTSPVGYKVFTDDVSDHFNPMT